MTKLKDIPKTKKCFQRINTFFLLTCILFLGLPVKAQDTSDEKLKPSGKAVQLSKKIDGRYSKMGAKNFAEAKSPAAKSNSSIAKTTGSNKSEQSYIVFNIEFKSAAARNALFTDEKVSKLKNAYVLTVIDRFADIFVDYESGDTVWNTLWRNKDVVKVEQAAEVDAPPPPDATKSPTTSQAVPEPIVRGGYQGLTGKNVIITIIDTGVDFRHPDFITYDAQGRPTSRLAYLWDTHTLFQAGRGSEAPFKFPNGSSIGTLYTKDQLTAELRSSKINFPATDLDGHGTACAGIATGNGNAGKDRSEVKGVAPEADIIGVRMGEYGFENGYLLNAISEWLDMVAGKTPLVVSGSFGGHYTGHDGQSIEERQLDVRFNPDKTGRAIVLAAGNEGNDAIHAQVNFEKESKLVSWTAERPTYIKMFFDSADSEIAIYGTNATPLKEMYRSINPITNQLEATFAVNPGLGGIWLENKAGRSSEAHLYFFREDGEFSADNVSYSHLVGTPGSMMNAVTVGSYDWNDNFRFGDGLINLTSVCRNESGARMPLVIGWLSCYSSPGPSRRQGITKPDIVAPGEWFSSSYAKIPGSGGVENWDVDSSGNYAAMNGTSAATPYTAGIIALMFQKKPDLTLREVKDLLTSNASKNGLNAFSPRSSSKLPVQPIPNNNWGYGKLDMTAIEKIFAKLDAE